MSHQLKPLSNRTDNLTQSDIRAVTHMINAVGGINLGQGICDLPTPSPIKEGAIHAIEADKSIYSHYAGIEPLRRSIFEKARRFNELPVEGEDEVMVSIGSTGAFVAAIFALLDPGDEAILFEPFYGYHRNLLRLTGAGVRYVPTHGENWDIDFEEVERVITPATKLVVINTPSNPSGKVWSFDELSELHRLVEKHNLYVITDEIYEYMVYDDRRHVSFGSLPEAYPRTITLSGFSKTYNMTGWRLGYAVGPSSLIEKMGLLNDLFFICAPTPLQHGVAEAFTMPDNYFVELLQDYSKKRRMMCEALDAAGFTFSWPQGAYYVLAGVGSLAERHEGFKTSREACETIIRQAGVATVPGDSFFSEGAPGPMLRFCYAKEFPVLEEACRQIVATYG